MADPAPGQPAVWTLMDFTAEDRPAEQLAQGRLLGQELSVAVDAATLLEEDLKPAGWARADQRASA